jgi:hypothetical protein
MDYQTLANKLPYQRSHRNVWIHYLERASLTGKETKALCDKITDQVLWKTIIAVGDPETEKIKAIADHFSGNYDIDREFFFIQLKKGLLGIPEVKKQCNLINKRELRVAIRMLDFSPVDLIEIAKKAKRYGSNLWDIIFQPDIIPLHQQILTAKEIDKKYVWVAIARCANWDVISFEDALEIICHIKSFDYEKKLLQAYTKKLTESLDWNSFDEEEAIGKASQIDHWRAYKAAIKTDKLSREEMIELCCKAGHLKVWTAFGEIWQKRKEAEK